MQELPVPDVSDSEIVVKQKHSEAPGEPTFWEELWDGRVGSTWDVLVKGGVAVFLLYYLVKFKAQAQKEDEGAVDDVTRALLDDVESEDEAVERLTTERANPNPNTPIVRPEMSETQSEAAQATETETSPASDSVTESGRKATEKLAVNGKGVQKVPRVRQVAMVCEIASAGRPATAEGEQDKII
jgi:hypothetical protein